MGFSGAQPRLPDVHNWINNGSEPCVVFYALIGADAVKLGNGMSLPAEG